MKKVISLIAILAICLSLCGCGLLDDLRESRATVDAEGNIQLNDGAVYKPLPACKELSPAFDEMKMVYVVESEVPLLLTSMIGEYFDLSDDGKFLQNYLDGESIFYCRADVYDSVLDRIMNGFAPNTCCYWYYDYSMGKVLAYTLTEAQLEAVNQVCLTQEPQILPSAASMNWDYWVTLTMCTDDLLFMKELVDICMVEGKWYVVDESGVDTIFYTVPEELTSVFADIMNIYIQVEDSYWTEW